jgi:PST family polysaccharide transporter
MAKYQVVRPVKIGYKQVKLHLQISTSYFISRSAAVFTDKSVAVFIGNYIGMSSLAYYDLLLKLVEIGRAPFGILNQVFYPKIAGNKDMKLALLLIKFSAISSAFMVLAMYAYTDQIMFFLGGHEMMKYGAIFHLFSLSIITAAISYQLGNSVLVVMGREKHFNLSVIFQSCLIVCGLSVIKISDSISLYSVIFTLTIAALFELCYRSWFVRNILKSYLK